MALTDALAQLDYPCRYPFKCLCRPRPGICDEIRHAVAAEAPDWNPDDLAERPSRNGRYVALTATIVASDATQIERIYRRLGEVDGILTSL